MMISDAVQIALITAVPTTIAAAGAVVAILRTRKVDEKLNTLTVHVDGKMDQLLESSGKVQHALGVQAGREMAVIEKAARVAETERVEVRAIAETERAEDRADQRASLPSVDEPIKVKIVKPDLRSGAE